VLLEAQPPQNPKIRAQAKESQATLEAMPATWQGQRHGDLSQRLSLLLEQGEG
jgi:hypothetical protein